jgi:DNA-binding transcriptional regulator YiaG
MTPHHIASIRAQLGLTQPQFASALGIHRVTLAKYEGGTLNPPAWFVVLLRYVEKFGVLPNDA